MKPRFTLLQTVLTAVFVILELAVIAGDIVRLFVIGEQNNKYYYAVNLGLCILLLAVFSVLIYNPKICVSPEDTNDPDIIRQLICASRTYMCFISVDIAAIFAFVMFAAKHFESPALMIIAGGAAVFIIGGIKYVYDVGRLELTERDDKVTEEVPEEKAEETTAEEVPEEKAEETSAEEVTEEKAEETAAEEVPEEKAEETTAEEVTEEKAEETSAEDVPEEKAEKIATEEIPEEKAKKIATEEVTEEKAEETAAEEVSEQKAEEKKPAPVKKTPANSSTNKYSQYNRSSKNSKKSKNGKRSGKSGAKKKKRK